MVRRRFPTAAEAIKYAVETLENVALLSAALVVGEDRFGASNSSALRGETIPAPAECGLARRNLIFAVSVASD